MICDDPYDPVLASSAKAILGGSPDIVCYHRVGSLAACYYALRGPSKVPTIDQAVFVVSQTDTCLLLADVKACPRHPPHRPISRIPASLAIRSSSLGQA